jgi:hypothetical protein
VSPSRIKWSYFTVSASSFERCYPIMCDTPPTDARRSPCGISLARCESRSRCRSGFHRMNVSCRIYSVKTSCSPEVVSAANRFRRVKTPSSNQEVRSTQLGSRERCRLVSSFLLNEHRHKGDFVPGCAIL